MHLRADILIEGSAGGARSSGAGQRVSVIPVREAKKQSLMEAAISDVLAIFGFKRKLKKDDEIVVYGEKMPIQAAKPMAEKAMAAKSPREQKRPEAEGLMALSKKKKSVSVKKKQ